MDILKLIVPDQSLNFKDVLNTILFTTINIIFMIVVLLALMKLLIFISNRIIKQNRKKLSNQRIKTIQIIVENLIKYLISVTIFIGVLLNFGITGQSLAAGAGIFGIIIALGSKELISDMVNGFFIIFEGIYDVGEYVSINNLEGYVQKLGVKSTLLLTSNNELITIPNSKVEEVVNYSKKNFKTFYHFYVGLDEEVSEISKIVNNEVLPKLNENEKIIEFEYLGIERFTPDFIEYTISISTHPEDRFRMNREVNLIIKLVFEKNKISLPGNKLIINQKNN